MNHWPTWSEFSSFLTALGVLLSILVSLRNSRKIDDVHKATNGLRDKLVAANRSDADQTGEARGIIMGREAQKSDDKERTK